MNETSGAYAKDDAGFTIVELVVVVAIIATLLTIGTVEFNSWMTKNRVESQVNKMVTDFNELRLRAITRKQRHSITLNPSSYVLRSYSSVEESVSTGGTVIPGGTKSVVYQLKTNSTTVHNGSLLEITDRGLLLNVIVNGTVQVSPVADVYLDTTASANIDCLAIHTARTNPGKKNAAWSACDDK